MDDTRVKADLHRYLQASREALLWKLQGLGEYDVRRPLVPMAWWTDYRSRLERTARAAV
jgi:hypothetical protein